MENNKISVKSKCVNYLKTLPKRYFITAFSGMAQGLFVTLIAGTILAQIAGWMASTGVSVSELQNYEENIKNVSLENVLNEADFVWNKAPKATGILYAKENE